jgi:hypothetical protein
MGGNVESRFLRLPGCFKLSSLAFEVSLCPILTSGDVLLESADRTTFGTVLFRRFCSTDKAFSKNNKSLFSIKPSLLQLFFSLFSNQLSSTKAPAPRRT